MTYLSLSRKAALGVMTAAALSLGAATTAQADGHQVVDSIHFLIPGGAGGGWDGTARGTGEALTGQALWGPHPTRTCLAAAAVKPSAT